MECGTAAFGTPMIVGAMNKSGTKLPVTGKGAFQYEVIHDWGELPASIKYGKTHGVCEDSQGHIYVHHTADDDDGHDTMVVFDTNGKFVKSWGKDFRGGAHGLHIHQEGSQEFLYLCDTNRALVVKTTLSGEEVSSIGYPNESEQYKPDAEGKKRKYSPTNLAIAPNGDIYVGDGYGSSYINQYSATGEFIRTFGGPGSGPGQLSCPHGITVDTRGDEPVLTVADRGNKRIQNFTLDGKHINFVEGVSAPCHFSERKGVFVIPDLDSRVTLMDENNNIIEHLGTGDASTARTVRTQPRETFIPGQFICPHGACWDHEGNIFVVEWVEAGRVTKLRKV